MTSHTNSSTPRQTEAAEYRHRDTISLIQRGGQYDLVPDDTYQRLATMNTPAPLRITTTPLRKTFIGGMLDLDHTSGTVRAIIERPPGGCPPGAAANIWIHYIDTAETITALTEATRRLDDYEAAINHLITNGTTAIALPVPHWVSIKNPDSIRDAHEMFTLDIDLRDDTRPRTLKDDAEARTR